MLSSRIPFGLIGIVKWLLFPCQEELSETLFLDPGQTKAGLRLD